jgi:hypothetical protein
VIEYVVLVFYLVIFPGVACVAVLVSLVCLLIRLVRRLAHGQEPGQPPVPATVASGPVLEAQEQWMLARLRQHPDVVGRAGQRESEEQA